MESILAALTGGGGAARGVVLSNSRSRAVTEMLLDELAKCIEKYNCLIERTYRREQNVAVNRRDVEQLDGRMGR